MRTVLHSLLTLVWGLWFGGVVALFVAITGVFRAFPSDRDTAGETAVYVFRGFNRYQLALAAAALLVTFAWCLWQRGKMKMGLFLLFGLATVDACIITMRMAPTIERMHRERLTHTPEFIRMHEYAMLLYLAEAVILLIAGLMLPWLRQSAARIPTSARGQG